MRGMLFASGCALVLSSAVFAQDATPSAPIPAATPAPAQPEKKICRSEPQLNTRLPGPRICMTKSQWESQSRQAKDMVTAAQNNGVSYVAGGR